MMGTATIDGAHGAMLPTNTGAGSRGGVLVQGKHAMQPFPTVNYRHRKSTDHTSRGHRSSRDDDSDDARGYSSAG